MSYPSLSSLLGSAGYSGGGLQGRSQIQVTSNPPTVQQQRPSLQTVYDASYYGYDLPFFLEVPGMTIQNVTQSTANYQFSKDTTFNSGGTATPFRPLVHDQSMGLSTVDPAYLLHLGNNTAFNQNYGIEADMTAALYQVQMMAAFALNCSAFVSGSLTITGVTLQVGSLTAGNVPAAYSTPAIPYFIAPNTAFTPLVATGTQIFIVRAGIDFNFVVRNQALLTLNITVNTTISGTNTSQVGIMPLYKISNTDTSRYSPLYASMITGHIHPVPEHIEEVVPLTRVKMIGFDNLINVS